MNPMERSLSNTIMGAWQYSRSDRTADSERWPLKPIRKTLNVRGLRLLDCVASELKGELEAYGSSPSHRESKEIVKRSLAAIESGFRSLKKEGVGDDTADFETKYRVYKLLMGRFGDIVGFDLGFRAAKAFCFTNQPVPLLSPDGEPAADPIAAERRRRIDNYIKEVFKISRKRITRKDIWESAKYKTATEFQRWQRNEPRSTPAIDELFTEILEKKPHLK